MAEKIEGFYLDGTKYEFEGGGGTEYNAGKGILIRDTTNARKGPSPEGFRVPSIDEWQGLKTIMDGLSLTTGDDWRINLHMPFAGYRKYQSATLDRQDTEGDYWSSSPYGSNLTALASSFSLQSSNVNVDDYFSRASALSVRCFKNSYVTPDSNWTVVQGTLGSAGIFWNQSEGLISITDGTTGYTIMDKNLGATTVYNDGDTLTEANMGNMYQWGNNYGFLSTGTISKTSSTKVNASGYGPINPYSSDTFITGSSDRSSVHNDDLWGDTTGAIEQENVISNTGVLSVNGQTGNVTVTEGTGINISQNVISADISSADGKEYKITKVRKLPSVIDASTIYFVWTPQPFGDTITVSWTETSNPAEFNPIWSDGAADAEVGDERFDNWFGYSGVKLSSTGTETATASQTDGVLDITQLGTLTSGDNVMIKFPVRGIKMSKSGNVVTLSMTKELNKSGYQYYAFNRNGTIKNQLYLGAYKGSRVSNVLKSWSGQAAATSSSSDGVGYIALVNTTSGTPTAGARYSARQNNTSISTGINGWDVETWYARNYVNALYMMKYGNPNSQSVIGVGYTGGPEPTGATDSITNATGATNTGYKGRIKLFGLEDRWGNGYELLDGTYVTSNKNLNVASTNVLTNTSWSTSSAPFNTNIDIQTLGGGYLKGTSGTNEGMFASIDGGGSDSTYYCDSFMLNADKCVGAGYASGTSGAHGIFAVQSNTLTYAYSRNCARLMFL